MESGRWKVKWSVVSGRWPVKRNSFGGGSKVFCWVNEDGSWAGVNHPSGREMMGVEWIKPDGGVVSGRWSVKSDMTWGGVKLFRWVNEVGSWAGVNHPSGRETT